MDLLIIKSEESTRELISKVREVFDLDELIESVTDSDLKLVKRRNYCTNGSIYNYQYIEITCLLSCLHHQWLHS